jgi:hypothetical protein
MTRPPPHTHDEVPPEVEAFADDIRHAMADDNAPLSIVETFGEPGTESVVTFCVRGLPLFYFRRDEFLEAMYVAGCGVMEDLERKGLPLAAADGPPRPRLVQ